MNESLKHRKDFTGVQAGLHFCYSHYALYVFERHIDDDNHKNVSFTPLIDCHDPGRTV